MIGLPTTCGACESIFTHQDRCAHESRGPLRAVQRDGAPPRLCPLRPDVNRLRRAEAWVRSTKWQRMLAGEAVARAMRLLVEADAKVLEAEAEASSLALVELSR